MARRVARNRLSFGILLLAALVACGQGEENPHSTSTAPATTATGSLATAQSSAGSTGESDPSPDHPWTGNWSGRFKAEKGDVSVPEGVPYPTWDGDDGFHTSGDGAVSVTIGPEGEVTGTGRGALGAFAIRGRVEGETLRAGISPAPGDDDPRDADVDVRASGGQTSVTGVLIAKEKGEALEAKLRVSGARGARVRTATFMLSEGARSASGGADPATPAPSASAPR